MALKKTEGNEFNTSVEWKKIEYRRWQKITTLEAEEKSVDLSKGGQWNRNSPLKPKTVKRKMMMTIMHLAN